MKTIDELLKIERPYKGQLEHLNTCSNPKQVESIEKEFWAYAKYQSEKKYGVST